MCHNNCVYTKKYITNHRNVLLISFIQFQLIINCRQRDLNPRKGPQTLINQRIDGSATLPAIKDIVFLIVYATIFIWLIKNSVDICAAAYDTFNDIVNGISQVKIDSLDAITVSEKVGDSPGAAGSLFVTSLAMLLASFAVNDEVKICTLPKGKYLLTVESAPDGYDKPAKSTSFTVKGDGKKVSAFAFLAKHVDKTAKSGESEDNAEATPADGASQNQDASSDGQNQNNQAENSSADMNRGASAPSSGNGQPSSTSTPTTTKTIHHPAETIRIAICDTCGADITDDIEGHKKSTGHPWYHYDAKVVKEAWDETVTVN